jgi:hypothetical protein
MSVWLNEPKNGQEVLHNRNRCARCLACLLRSGHRAKKIVSAADLTSPSRQRKIITKYNIFLRAQNSLILDGYDPRIHTLYFCPQLFTYDSDNRLFPIGGEEIGKLLAETVPHGVVERQSWYEPSDELPNQPIIATTIETNFDALIVDRPVAHAPTRNAESEPAAFESAHGDTEVEYRAP